MDPYCHDHYHNRYYILREKGIIFFMLMCEVILLSWNKAFVNTFYRLRQVETIWISNSCRRGWVQQKGSMGGVRKVQQSP